MTTTKQDKIIVPYFSKYFFYGSYLFPLFALPAALLSLNVENFASYSVIPLIFLLILSLHRVSWGKRPRFGAHFSWAMLGFSLPVAIQLLIVNNWIGFGFLAVFMIVNFVARRRFCRALARLPKL